jgi:hypothetical protein
VNFLDYVCMWWIVGSYSSCILKFLGTPILFFIMVVLTYISTMMDILFTVSTCQELSLIFWNIVILTVVQWLFLCALICIFLEIVMLSAFSFMCWPSSCLCWTQCLFSNFVHLKSGYLFLCSRIV